MRDLAVRDADSLLKLNSSRYLEILVVYASTSHVVSTSKISKRTDKCVVRKLCVVL